MLARALKRDRLHPPGSSVNDDAESSCRGAQECVLEAITVLRPAGTAAANASGPFGDAEAHALGVIYRAYGEMLRAVARRYVGTDEADDVVHDMFCRLPTVIRQYRNGGFGGWLKQCTVRLALMRLRRARRWHAMTACSRSADEEVTDARDHQMLGVGEDLRRALAQLPEPLRAVVVLRIYHGQTHAEIAARLGISPNASEIRFCRAIKQLRRALCPDRASPTAGTQLAHAS